MSTARWIFPAVALCLSLSLSQSAQLLSLDHTGARSGDVSVGESFAISGNGRFVAFSSRATDHVDNDTNGTADLFVHDCAQRRHIWDTTASLHYPPITRPPRLIAGSSRTAAIGRSRNASTRNQGSERRLASLNANALSKRGFYDSYLRAEVRRELSRFEDQKAFTDHPMTDATAIDP